MRWLDGVTDAMDRNFGEPRETVEDRESWRAAAHGVTESRVQLGDGTTTIVLSQQMALVQYTVLFQGTSFHLNFSTLGNESAKQWKYWLLTSSLQIRIPLSYILHLKFRETLSSSKLWPHPVSRWFGEDASWPVNFKQIDFNYHDEKSYLLLFATFVLENQPGLSVRGVHHRTRTRAKVN